MTSPTTLPAMATGGRPVILIRVKCSVSDEDLKQNLDDKAPRKRR